MKHGHEHRTPHTHTHTAVGALLLGVCYLEYLCGPETTCWMEEVEWCF